jgi:hypothetical protein
MYNYTLFSIDLGISLVEYLLTYGTPHLPYIFWYMVEIPQVNQPLNFV